MPSARNLFGAIAVFSLGSLIFITPDTMLPERLTGGHVQAQQLEALSAYPIAKYLAKIESAGDTYFKAAMTLEKDGESPEHLAKIKRADDNHFEAVTAIEVAPERAIALAKPKAAGDAYFKAAIALEASEQQSGQMTELKLQENTPAPEMFSQRPGDDLITGSIAENISPAAEAPATVMATSDDYSDAVIAIETSGANPENSAQLKITSDAYFNAAISHEAANAETTAAMTARSNIKMAAASPPPVMTSPAAPMAKKAPLPPKLTKPNRWRQKKRTVPAYVWPEPMKKPTVIR